MVNIFGENSRIEKLGRLGNPLEKLNEYINWSMFDETLRRALAKDRSKGGRPPYSYQMMFKIMILQRIYNISDDNKEYPINDRISFQRFLGIKEYQEIPDAKTIWNFRNELVKAKVDKQLFEIFHQELEKAGVITRKGSIVDASFVECPQQRNTKEENEEIRNGKVPRGWKRNKLVQKDTDARWTKKGGKLIYGYKNHVKVDQASKVIIEYEITPASVHDSQVYRTLLDEKDKETYADSAYIGQEVAEGIIQNVVQRAKRNQPLTVEEKERNKAISKIRSRVEHVFGFIENSLKGSTFRGIGAERARFNVGITNLTYNLFRFTYLRKQVAVL
jgi:IS5 family transposase